MLRAELGSSGVVLRSQRQCPERASYNSQSAKRGARSPRANRRFGISATASPFSNRSPSRQPISEGKPVSQIGPADEVVLFFKCCANDTLRIPPTPRSCRFTSPSRWKGRTASAGGGLRARSNAEPSPRFARPSQRERDDSRSPGFVRPSQGEGDDSRLESTAFRKQHDLPMSRGNCRGPGSLRLGLSLKRPPSPFAARTGSVA